MEQVKINIKKIKDRVFFSLPTVVCDPGNLSETTGIIMNGVLSIPIFSSFIGVTDEQLQIIKKLASIKFEDRTVKNVDAQLSVEQKKILKQMVASGAVTVYRRGKYKDRNIYAISDLIYPLINKKSFDYTTKASPVKKSVLPEYMVLGSKTEASKISNKYSQEIKKGLLMGVRDIGDKKYYIISKKYYEKVSGKIIDSLSQKPLTYEQVCKQLKLNPTGCKSVLLFLAEQGIIYFKGGKYRTA